MDVSTINFLPNKSENFKEDLLPKPFNLTSSYNESWIEELVSKFRLFNSSQHHFNQSMAIKNFIANLRPNTSGNCQEWYSSNASQQSDPDDLTLDIGRYIGGYATVVIACIGLILNAVGIYLLSRKKGYKSMNNILHTINLILDIFFLVFQIPRSMCTYFVSSNPSATYHIITYSGHRFTQIASVLMLVALAHSRYQAVTNPYNVRKLKFSWSSRRMQVLRYLLPAIFFATCFTIPVIYEVDTEKFTSCNITLDIVVPSEMRMNFYYSIFFLGSLNLVFLGLFPFFILLYFSYYIKKSLTQRLGFISTKPNKESLKRRNLMKNTVVQWKAPDHESTQNKRHCNSNKATKTLFLMVFTFILLHSLRFVTSLGEFIVSLGKNKISDEDLKYYGGPEWLYVVVVIGNICMVINASVNFLIYLYLNSSKKYKLVHFCIPLINNTLLSTINVNQPTTALQRPACKEAPLPVKGTNDIVLSVVPNAPFAYNLSLPSKILNDNEGFKVRKRSVRKTRHFEAEWV